MLKDIFAGVYLINLRRRPDRLAAVLARLDQIGWPFLPPEAVPAVDGSLVPTPPGWQAGGGAWGCVLPGAIVQGRVQKVLKSWYAGPCVELITLSGQRIALTINHPVLTENGFIPAGHVKKTDNLVCYRSHVRGSQNAASMNDPQKPPTPIEEIFEACLRQGALRRSKLSSHFDLYGDGEFLQGNIDVVNVVGPLLLNRNTEYLQGAHEDAFRRRDVQKIALASRGASSPRCLNLLPPPSGRSRSYPFAVIANGYASLHKNSVDSGWSPGTGRSRTGEEAKFARQFHPRFTSQITTRDFFLDFNGQTLLMGENVSFQGVTQDDAGSMEFTSQGVAGYSDFPAGTIIIGIANSQQATLSQNATASVNGELVTILGKQIWACSEPPKTVIALVDGYGTGPNYSDSAEIQFYVPATNTWYSIENIWLKDGNN